MSTGNSSLSASSASSYASGYSARSLGSDRRRRPGRSFRGVSSRAFDPQNIATQGAQTILRTQLGRDAYPEEVAALISSATRGRACALGEDAPTAAGVVEPAANTNCVCVRCVHAWDVAMGYKKLLMEALKRLAAVRDGASGRPDMGCLSHLTDGERMRTTRACAVLDQQTQAAVQSARITVGDGALSVALADPDATVRRMCRHWITEHVMFVDDGVAGPAHPAGDMCLDTPILPYVRCQRRTLRRYLGEFVHTRFAQRGVGISNTTFADVVQAEFGIDISKPARTGEFGDAVITTYEHTPATRETTIESLLRLRFLNSIERKRLAASAASPVARVGAGGESAPAVGEGLAPAPVPPRSLPPAAPGSSPSPQTDVDRLNAGTLLTSQQLWGEDLANALCLDWERVHAVMAASRSDTGSAFAGLARPNRLRTFRSVVVAPGSGGATRNVGSSLGPDEKTPCVFAGTTKRGICGHRRALGAWLKDISGTLRCRHSRKCIRPAHFTC